MKAYISHANTSSKPNINNDNTYNSIGISAKHQMYSGFDKPDSKVPPLSSFSQNKNPRKFSKLDILNNSHLSSINEEKRASPMLFGYLKTEPQKDISYSSGLKKSTRLNTGESDKLPRRHETSFDSAYADKQRLLNDPKRKILPVSYNSRVPSHNRVVRNIPIRDVSMTKNNEDLSIESRRRRLYQNNMQDKRPSAQMDTSLPSIYINDEKHQRDRSFNKSPIPVGETQNGDMQLLNKITKKEAMLINNKMSRIPLVSNLKNENSKFLKTFKIRHENSFTPHINKLSSSKIDI